MPQQPGSSSQSFVMASNATQIAPNLRVGEYLQNNGSNDLAVDGSTPVVFSYAPPAGFNFLAVRMMIYMESQTAFASDKFGNLAKLANGVQINCGEVGIANWKDNIDIVTEMYDFARDAFGKADKLLVSRWTFTRDTFGKCLLVPDGQSFSAVIQDDLSDLIVFRMKIKGVLVNA